jgi:hypothetical protein
MIARANGDSDSLNDDITRANGDFDPPNDDSARER